MKYRKYILLFWLLLCLGACVHLKTDAPKTKVLRHMVAFKFKPGTTPEQMQKATIDFLNLKSLVPEIIAVEGGPDVNFEKKNGKFTHCFIVTVKDEKELAAYGAHPNHKAFSKSVDPLLAEVMIVDYWTE